MYTKDLSANVPLYGQEQCCYCGPASAQMTRNGYPNPGDRLYYTQNYLWNIIQSLNSTAPADAALNWCTDPQGLTACLQSLSNPAGVHWVEFNNANRDALLFNILFWMNNREFASPVLINEGEHWVVIVGFETDVAPLAGSTPTLQKIYINDPEPHNVGTFSIFTAAQWFSGPWNKSIRFTGTWYHKYAAVVEPPVEEGNIIVKTVDRSGKELISPTAALEFTRRWIDELKLTENPRYSLLRHEGIEAFEPLLVREESMGREQEAVPYYYIVPFGFKSEFTERGGHAIRVAILVNAYSGNFEEATVFGEPIRYLSKEEALRIVSAKLGHELKRLEEAKITLMFVPSEITHIRTYPFWRVSIGERTVYVDQLGEIYWKLLPSRPGD
jgi:hypothetical protein